MNKATKSIFIWNLFWQKGITAYMKFLDELIEKGGISTIWYSN